jgi:uncharacterized DUF497 family protein
LNDPPTAVGGIRKRVECLWKRQLIEKLEQKHRLSKSEVEEVFDANPPFNFIAKGEVTGQNLYRALGRTDAGRYLTVLFVQKRAELALVISARDMTLRERRRYGKK